MYSYDGSGTCFKYCLFEWGKLLNMVMLLQRWDRFDRLRSVLSANILGTLGIPSSTTKLTGFLRSLLDSFDETSHLLF